MCSIGIGILLAISACAQEVYEKDQNIYFRDVNNKESQLTFKGKDYGAKLSPDREKIIFVREIKPCPGTSDAGWMPSDCEEIWAVNVDGSNEHRIIKSNYAENPDMSYYLGSFDSLNFSPDGNYIFFLSQHCAVDAILYRANFDGSNIKRLSNAHQLDVVGGYPKDEYYGHPVVGIRKLPKGASVIKWSVVLMAPDGHEIKEIDNLDLFWKTHKKL